MAAQAKFGVATKGASKFGRMKNDTTIPGGTEVQKAPGNRKPVRRDVRSCYYALTWLYSVYYQIDLKAAEGVILLVNGKISGNSQSARDQVRHRQMPCIAVHFGIGEEEDVSPAKVASWIRKHRFTSLLVAVAREGWPPEPHSLQSPGVLPKQTREFFRKVAAALAGWGRLIEVGRAIPAIHGKEYERRLYRHGDLMIGQIGELPEGIRPIATTLLAEGEHTGHAHELRSTDVRTIEVYEDGNGLRYFKTEGALLVHEEHEAIFIKEGIYSVMYEQEYDYFRQIRIPVAD